jgi:N-methylhydantoinase B
MAEGAGNIWNIQTAGFDRRRGRPYTYIFFTAGGTGARPTKDGLSNAAFPSGIMGVPTEVVESVAPVLLRRKEVRPDSAGAGIWRGGLGQELVLTVRTDQPWVLASMFDRTQFAPRGLFGGQDAALGRSATGDGRSLHPKERLTLAPGSEVVLSLPGGAGYGEPHQRPPALVEADVRNGYVSIAAARQQYGVVIQPATLTVDAAATAALRAERG